MKNSEIKKRIESGIERHDSDLPAVSQFFYELMNENIEKLQGLNASFEEISQSAMDAHEAKQMLCSVAIEVN